MSRFHKNDTATMLFLLIMKYAEESLEKNQGEIEATKIEHTG